jgi:hemin uptake protein HemP
MSQPQSAAPHRIAPPPAEAPALDSKALFGPAREVLIRHDGALYRLRLTRAGKLILTK